MLDFVAFDVETTGINVENDSIIEVAAVRFSQGRPKEKFSSLVNSGHKIPASAIAVNGITDEMVKGSPVLFDVLAEFSSFCGRDILVAHRASFDFKFLAAAFRQESLVAPSGLILDTLNIARQSLPGLISYRLSSLVKHFGLEVESGFHRAALDSYCCGLVFLKLLGEIGAGATVPLENIINLSGAELHFPQEAKEDSQLKLF